MNAEFKIIAKQTPGMSQIRGKECRACPFMNNAAPKRPLSKPFTNISAKGRFGLTMTFHALSKRKGIIPRPKDKDLTFLFIGGRMGGPVVLFFVTLGLL